MLHGAEVQGADFRGVQLQAELHGHSAELHGCTLYIARCTGRGARVHGAWCREHRCTVQRAKGSAERQSCRGAGFSGAERRVQSSEVHAAELQAAWCMLQSCTAGVQRCRVQCCGAHGAQCMVHSAGCGGTGSRGGVHRACAQCAVHSQAVQMCMVHRSGLQQCRVYGCWVCSTTCRGVRGQSCTAPWCWLRAPWRRVQGHRARSAGVQLCTGMWCKEQSTELQDTQMWLSPAVPQPLGLTEQCTHTHQAAQSSCPLVPAISSSR